MISLLARVSFISITLCLGVFFVFFSDTLNIETNLNDLNPAKAQSQEIEHASDALIADISQRFIVVIKAKDELEIASANERLQRQLNALEHLQVMSPDATQSAYLSALSDYRFNVLSEAQRQSLYEPDIQALANEAQRKLYQLGDGLRLIPFEQDPLGWFSDFLLTRLDEAGLASAIDGDNELPQNASADNQPSYFTSFSVLINNYPAGMAQQEALYQQIKGIESEISAEFAVTILHSGMFFFAVDSAQSAKGDIQLIAIGSIVGVLVLMLLVFRSLLPLFLSLGSIAIGVGFGLFVSTMVFGSIHVLTIVFGASLIGIVVDYSLHYFYHFLAREQTDIRIESKAARKNHLVRAMVLSVLTSMIGYAALSLTDLVILKKIALFSCSGLFMAWLGVMVLGPLLTKRPIVARQTLLTKVIHSIQYIFARSPRMLVTTGLVLCGISGVYLYVDDINTNDDPRRFFHVSPELLKHEQEVASLTQVYEPGRFAIVQGKSDEEVFQAIQTFYDALGTLRGQVSSVIDWLPAESNQRLNYDLQEALYKDGGVIDTFYEQLGIPLSQSSSIKREYAEAANQYLGFEALSESLPALPPLWIEHNDTISSFILIRKNSDFDAIEQAALSSANIQYINTLGNAMKGLKAQRIEGAQLLIVAYVLIALMLILYYRRLSIVLLLLVPVCASVITIALLGALGQAITVFHIMALFLVLGLGMDYIIFAKEITDQRSVTQQAILLSAITSLLSFGLLAFSSMPVVQAFGSTILIGNTINFIAAICLFNPPRMQREKITNVGE